MNRLAFFSLTALLVAALAGPARAGLHRDERLGFQIVTPKGWSQIPVGISEKWIVAKFKSDKTYREMDEDGWPIEFKPDLRVILFPFEVTKKRGPKKEEVETPGGTVTVTDFGFENPYKDYKDYLQKNYSGGGWYVSKEEERKGKGKDPGWTLWEIKVEKLARSGKKRLVAGIFHAGDADFVVQFEVLEGDYGKLRSLIYGSLNSFRFIPRKGSLVDRGGPARDGFVDEGELTPRERKKRRLRKVEAAFEKAKRQLPKDWASFTYKGKFLVLSHVDKKSAVELLNPGLGVWTWLDKNFDYLGDEYVRPLIVRICKDSDEASAYQDSSGGITFFSSTFEEVVLYKRESNSFGGIFVSFGGLPGRVMSNWFHDKDQSLYWDFPGWLQSGLNDLFGSARLKGSRLVFPPDAWDVRDIKIAASKGTLRPVKELLTSGYAGFSGPFSAQASAFVRFLLLGPGARMKRTKTFLETYIRALKERSLEERKKEEEERAKASPDEKPKTEEEEEEEFRKRRQAASGKEWEKKRKAFLASILARAFPDWTDKDWASVDRAYRATILR